MTEILSTTTRPRAWSSSPRSIWPVESRTCSWPISHTPCAQVWRR